MGATAGHISRWRILWRVLFAVLAIHAANDTLLHLVFSPSSDEVTIAPVKKAAQLALVKSAAADDDERRAVHPGGLAAEPADLPTPNAVGFDPADEPEVAPPSPFRLPAWARGPPLLPH